MKLDPKTTGALNAFRARASGILGYPVSDVAAVRLALALAEDATDGKVESIGRSKKLGLERLSTPVRVLRDR